MSAAGRLAAVLVVGCAAIAGSQTAPLRYRRAFVPQDQLDPHVRGLLPLKRAEFERRASEDAARPQMAPAARLDEAEYRARLNGEQLVEGTAELAVVLAGKNPAFLPLEPLNLALAASAWDDAIDRPATLGLASGGKIACLVPKSGTLDLQWSLRGQREQGELVFDIRIPPAASNRLRIETPADKSVTASVGIVTHAGHDNARGVRSWLVQLGGQSQTKLHIGQSATSAAAKPQVLVREDASYVVGPASADVDVTLDLQVLHLEIRTLTLVIDEALQPTAIEVQQQEVDWTPLPASGGQRRLLIELPEPWLGDGKQLRLAGIALWPDQGPWPLPRVRLEDGVWQGGRTTVTAPAALGLAVTPHGGCRQTAYVPATAASALDQFQLQSYLPDATVTLQASAARPQLIETSGLHLACDATQISGTLVAELTAAAGERFEIEAVIPQMWIVDAVDVQPVEFLEDRGLAPRGPGKQALRLALKRPLVEGRTLRVVIKAHFRRPPAGEPLPDELFQLAEFSDRRQVRRWVSLRSLDPGLQVRLEGDQAIARLDAAALTAAQLRLFEQPPGPILFEQSREADAVRAVLAPASPRFHVDSLVQTFVGAGEIRERVRLRCQPEASAIGHVQLRMSPAAPAARWQFVGAETVEIFPQPFPEGAGGDAVLNFELPLPQAVNFEIVGEFTQPFSGSKAIVLVAAPAAATQTGTAEVYSLTGQPLTFTATDMRALPLGDSDPSRLGSLRGLFAYAPGRREELLVAAPARAAAQGGWIDSLALQSRFGADGGGDHEAVIHLTSAGAEELTFRLATDAQPAADEPHQSVQVTIDGQPGQLAVAHPARETYSVRLSPGARQAVLRIGYASGPASMGYWPDGTFAAPVPQFDLPVLESRWTALLPPGLQTEAEPQAARAADERDPALAGWSEIELALTGRELAALHVYRPATLSAWSWCLALGAAAVALRLWAGRLAWVLLLALAAAALSLVAAPWWAPLCAGVAGGLVAAAAWLLIRPQPSGRIAALAPVGSTLIVAGGFARPVAPLVLGLGAIVAFAAAGAAPPAALPAPWRVVIPIDEKQQPAGDYVYLEPEFYDALVQARPAGGDQIPWLIAAAEIRLAGPPHGEGPRRGIDEISLKLDLETFRDDALCAVTLPRAQVHLLEGRAMLDGKPVQLDWSADGRVLQFPVTVTGHHRLELALGAVAAAADDGARLDLEIPPVPACRLVLAAAAGEHASVPSALGAEVAAVAGGERSWQLGPANRLTIHWPAGPNAAQQPARLEAEQLLVWKIRPGSVVVDGRFHLRPVGGKLGEIVLRCDPRLRLLPLDGSVSVARQWTEEGAASTIHLALREPAATDVDVRLSLLWAGSPGIGHLILPPVNIVADDVRRSWTAVTLASGLAWESPPAIRPGGPSLAQFATAFGQPLAEGVVWDAAAGSPPLAILPRQPEVTASQSLDCSISSRTMAVHYSANLAGLSAEMASHRVTLTPGLRVKRLIVTEQNRPVAARWTQEPGGSVVALLSQPPAADQRLDLEAELPLARDQRRLPVPLVRYVGAAHSDLTVQIDRQPDVLVTLAPPGKLWTPENDPAVGQYREGLGRLVARLKLAGPPESAPPVVTIAPNQPKTTGQLLIRVDRDASGWFAVAECLLEVQEGQLDVVRLQIPPQWTGPLEVEPAVEQRVLMVPGETGRWLVLRPQRALAGGQRLVIRGALRASGGELAVAPDVALVDAPRVQRIVALPSRVGSQKLTWETSGLQAAEAASLPWPAESIPPGFEAFQVVAPRFSAAARLTERSTAKPTVRLADYEVRASASGYAGRACFTLQPSAARHVTLELATAQRLVHVALDGAPAQLSQNGSRRWQISGLAEGVPQRLEVVFAGEPIMTANGNRLLSVPHLPELAVERTVWSLTGLKLAPGEIAQGHAIGPQALRLARLEAAVQALGELTGSESAELPPAAITNSWRIWRRHYGDERAALGTLDAAVLQDQTAERLASAAAAAQNARNLLTEAGHRLVDPISPASSPPAAGGATVSCLQFSGGVETLSLAPTIAAMPAADWRWTLAAAGLAAFVLLWLAAQNRAIRGGLVEHAHLVLALAGIAWVLAGPLAAWGWTLVAAAAWLAWRSPWRQTRPAPLSSIVRRSSLSR